MAFTGMSYDQFVADQRRKGINVQAGDGSYNRYTAAYSQGQAGANYSDSGGSQLTQQKPQQQAKQQAQQQSSQNMVRVGKELYRADQMFDVNIDSVAGPTKLNAVQLANLIQTGGGGGQGATRYSMGNTTEAGMLQDYKISGPRLTQQAPQAPAPAPAPAPRRASAPAPSFPAPSSKPRAVTQEERNEVTKPASGLEDTIKTSPSLLREKRRRSYLTRT